MCINKASAWKTNEKEMSREPYQLGYLSIYRENPTTDCKQIREERSNDKVENLVIFYSV